MTEKTEVEKAQEVFERKFAEQRTQNDHQFQVAMKIQDVRYTELREGFEDRKKELLAQNDGLLGAVGRLHAENEALRKQVPELEVRLQHFEREMMSMQERMKMQCEVVRVDARKEIDLAKANAKKEIDLAKANAKKEIDLAKAEAKAQVSKLTVLLEKARNQKKK